MGSLDMRQALTRRRDGAKCVRGEGKVRCGGGGLAAKAGRIRGGRARLRERLLVHIIRPKHPNGRWLRRRCAHREEQHIQFWNEERRSRPRNRCDVIYARIGILPGIENIQMAIPATDVDALAFCVHEHVVRIGAQVDVCNWSAVSHGKRAEFRRISECHDDMASSVVQGHGEISAAPRRPVRHCLSRGEIDDDDCLVGRIVDENPIRTSIELEALGMRLELDIGDLASAGRIDDRQCTMAVCHIYAIANCIHANVVRIGAQRDARDLPIIIPSENRSRSIAPVGEYKVSVAA